MFVVDAMALLQSIPSPQNTFGELAEVVFGMVTSTLESHGPRVDFVADDYPVESINGSERSKRAKAGALVIAIHNVSQKCPSQWKKFLSVGMNKINLIGFFLQ